jgi:hypothetical protein
MVDLGTFYLGGLNKLFPYSKGVIAIMKLSVNMSLCISLTSIAHGNVLIRFVLLVSSPHSGLLTLSYRNTVFKHLQYWTGGHIFTSNGITAVLRKCLSM